PVFALGTVLFFLIQHLRLTPEGRLALVLRRYNLPIALGSVALCVLAVRLPFPERLPFALPLVVPQLYVASLCFMAFVLTLCANPQSLFNNRPIRLLGQVSFSAYLWHFAFVHKLPVLFPAVFDRTVVDWQAIFACFALWLAVVSLTFAVSCLSFRWIETPMINLGRWLIEQRHFWITRLVRHSDLVSRPI
ncbi:MAG TPA: hypothetical protein VFL55_05420, partial [Acetobacteraceae bacterium]|nr:hypothetical protein [Acetobacteraceae bacterium]